MRWPLVTKPNGNRAGVSITGGEEENEEKSIGGQLYSACHNGYYFFRHSFSTAFSLATIIFSSSDVIIVLKEVVSRAPNLVFLLKPNVNRNRWRSLYKTSQRQCIERERRSQRLLTKWRQKWCQGPQSRGIIDSNLISFLRRSLFQTWQR